MSIFRRSQSWHARTVIWRKESLLPISNKRLGPIRYVAENPQHKRRQGTGHTGTTLHLMCAKTDFTDFSSNLYFCILFRTRSHENRKNRYYSIEYTNSSTIKATLCCPKGTVQLVQISIKDTKFQKHFITVSQSKFETGQRGAAHY